ncbi:MAG TPA: AI-2E family transporter [Terriglobales bacterium]
MSAIDTPPPATPTPTPPVADRPARRTHWAMNVLGLCGILALCYYGKIVFVVLLVAVLLAFILAPVVDLLTSFRLPRGLAAGIAMLLLLAVIAGILEYSYSQAATLFQDLPHYTKKVRAEFMQLRKSAESFEVLTPEHETGVLNVRPATDWSEVLTQAFGSVSEAVLAVSFIPFLAYFMLSWQHHVRLATVMLFPLEKRQTAYITLGLISSMIRSFMVGNLLIGLLIGATSTLVFWLIGLPFFYFVGFLSGFLSLIPYMGVPLAMLPPAFVALGHAQPQALVVIVSTVLVLHLIALNLIHPKFLGRRLQLNPLAVTLGLLLWGALWGAMGLVLAVPITAAMKIIFDRVDSLKPYGVWLGE